MLLRILLLLAILGSSHSMTCLQRRYSEGGGEVETMEQEDCSAILGTEASHCVLVHNGETKELSVGCSDKENGYCKYYGAGECADNSEKMVCLKEYTKKNKEGELTALPIDSGKTICCCKKGEDCFKAKTKDKEDGIDVFKTLKELSETKVTDPTKCVKAGTGTGDAEATTKDGSSVKVWSGTLLVILWSGASVIL